jgi:hypothetical protein
MNNGFFESTSGNRSSSRLIGFVIVCFALLENAVVLYIGRADVVQAAIAAGTLFITIAGPAMAFLFFQKGQEMKQEQDKTENINHPGPEG